MLKREVTIVNRLGLHARAAAKFVTQASRYASDIRLARGEREVNGKSIMGVMMLAASRGTTLEIRAEGPDAREALDSLTTLVDNRFDEED
ncbi:MAG: HPr family phosphocarrier protein [Candidatus Competibacteraceae bacterium]|nr:HPr family phosphocarrier protein [Candidatus Competibacteraceae bacterium]